VTHSELFNQPSSSVARTPKSTLGGFPASWSLPGSFMVGHQCVFDRGGGTRIPPSQHHEEQASPRVAASSLQLRFIPCGSPPCRTRPTQRSGSCPPAAPSGSVMILPEPPVDNSPSERRRSEKGCIRTGYEFIERGHDSRRPHTALNVDRRSSMNRSTGVSTKTQARTCPPKRGSSSTSVCPISSSISGAPRTGGISPSLGHAWPWRAMTYSARSCTPLHRYKQGRPGSAGSTRPCPW
jgi:hypothetical protein